MTEMDYVLTKLNLETHINVFQTEKITPDLVCKLSEYEMNCLGITSSTDMMRLRVECIKYGKQTSFSRKRNEPQFMISRNMLQSLLETGFKIKDIAQLLSVSESTIYRRMRQYNLTVYVFTDIDDETLDAKLNEVLTEFPRCGETMIRQILKTNGIMITRSRLRERLQLIDIQGKKERRRRRLHRRVYNVSAPNHLWHIDTNHKLIRWHFVIAGGVDGFSRFVVFLRCIDNNKSQTIFQCFKSGVDKYGIPLRVRSDQGLENYDVAKFMLETRGNLGMITGKSTHNQRIERLWRDVFEGVLCFFYDLFYFMEDEGILDPFNEIHIIALHVVFMQRINDKLDVWRNAWALHRLRTVHSSPYRLFMSGVINAQVYQNPSQNINTDISSTSDENTITELLQQENPRPVFESLTPVLNDLCRQELQLLCPSNWSSSNFGIDVYLQAVQIIERHM